jgi:hypothetical protein
MAPHRVTFRALSAASLYDICRAGGRNVAFSRGTFSGSALDHFAMLPMPPGMAARGNLRQSGRTTRPPTSHLLPHSFHPIAVACAAPVC